MDIHSAQDKTLLQNFIILLVTDYIKTSNGS